jgi:hypothetical protein
MLMGMSLHPFVTSTGKPWVLTAPANRNAMLVEQAREDALEMYRASKMDGLRKHVRNGSAKFGPSGKSSFEDGLR